MKLTTTLFIRLLLLGLAAPAAAQTAEQVAQVSVRERAVKRCEANRGVDCKSEAGLRPWLEEERPMSAEQQRSAAAARNKRETCAKTKGGALGC